MVNHPHCAWGLRRRRIAAPVAALASVVLAGAVLAGLPAASPAAAEPAGARAKWQSALLTDHPLVGRLWRPQSRTFILPPLLARAAARSDFVLLGETHDNPDHHRLQAWVLERLARRGHRPALAFEMITRAESDALAAYLAKSPHDPAGLGPAVDWEARGWPAWEMYRPVAAVAFAEGLPIVAAAPARKTVEAVMDKGLAALGAGFVARLGLDAPLPPEARAALRRELDEAHCELLRPATIARMIPAQRARDAVMAAESAEAAGRPGTDGAVLVTGFGHARPDRGVPVYLRRLAPRATILAVGMLEVEAEKTAPDDYLERPGAESFDVLWFSPRAEREDPCAGLAGRRDEDEKGKED